MAAPGPILKLVLRAPVGLYDLGAGRLLGRRFLLLRHRGRRSGRRYRTMLEVVRWDGERREAVAISGFGPRANWLLNSLAGGAEEVRIGGSGFRPAVRRLAPGEAAEAMAAYERRNRLLAPAVRAILSRLAGFRYDGSPAARRQLVEALPLVGFRDADGSR